MSHRGGMAGGLAWLLILPALTACASVTWQRQLVHREIPEEVLADLPRSGLTLSECLELLGAPTLVQEHRVDSVVLGWSWVDERTLGASVSIPVTDNQSVSLAYNDIRSREQGIVLWFDENRILRDWRRGYLSELMTRSFGPTTFD